MTYLITQTFILLLVAGLLGLALGWYLTRLSAVAQRTAMQAKLQAAESQVRELRAERDAATASRSESEASRQQLADELAALRAAPTPVPDDVAEELESLRGELRDCRVQLAERDAAVAISAEAPAPAPISAGPIAKVSAAAALAAAAMAGDSAPVAAAEAKPQKAVSPDPAGAGEPDDLQRIKGIGPKIAGILAEMGIHRFDQIAGWLPDEVEWVNERLKFKGRIEREQWIPQAKALLARRDADD